MQLALSTNQPPQFLKLLAHDIRWKLLRLLARSDYCVQASYVSLNVRKEKHYETTSFVPLYP